MRKCRRPRAVVYVRVYEFMCARLHELQVSFFQTLFHCPASQCPHARNNRTGAGLWGLTVTYRQCGRVIARFSFKQHLYRAVYYILHASESQVNSAHTHLRDTYILFMNYSWYVDQPTWRFSTAPHQCAKEGNIIKWLLCNRDLYELLVEIHSARLQSTKALPFLHARTSRCTISLVVSPVCMSHSPERTDHIRACAVMIPIAFPEPCAM